LNVLPLISVGFMIVHQKMFTPPPTDEQQEMQHKIMQFMMVFFGFMFFKVPAGLCLYFITSSAWGLAERMLLPKTPAAGGAGGGGTPTASPAPAPSGDGTDRQRRKAARSKRR
jgi:YidC/Oxa1 family membrane protein insertase